MNRAERAALFDAQQPYYAGNVNAAVLELIPPGSVVMDVGCGDGSLAQAMADKGCKVYGVDISPAAVEAARIRNRPAAVCDVEAEPLPFEGLQFDVVVLADVVEHLLRPETVLHKAIRRLAPRGLLVVSIPNVANWRVRLALLFGRFEYRPSGILDHTHVRFYTRRTAQNLFRRLGLEIEDRRYVFNFPPLVGRIRLFYKIAAVFNRPFHRWTALQLVYRLRPIVQAVEEKTRTRYRKLVEDV